MAQDDATEQFLKELDLEFKDRFTKQEEEYKRHCDGTVNEPPVLDDLPNKSNRGYYNKPERHNYNRNGNDRYNEGYRHQNYNRRDRY